MSTKSRESLYGTTIRMSTERAKEARKVADKLACVAWNHRMLGYKGPAQPSPTLGDALNAGYPYLEVRCLGCDVVSDAPALITCNADCRMTCPHTRKQKSCGKQTHYELHFPE